MKNVDKLEHMRDTKEKWEEVEYNLLEEKEINWARNYWAPCGYCKINERRCKKCSLSKIVIDGLPVCKGYKDISMSWAHKTLELADKGAFPEALRYCRIIIKEVIRDIHDIVNKETRRLKIKSSFIFIGVYVMPVLVMTAIGLVLLWKYV